MPNSMFHILLVLAALIGAVDASIGHADASKVDFTSDPPQYGVDCTSPIHYGIDKKQCPYFYDVYHKIMERCYAYYSKEECDANERDRLRMNLAQARSQHNYTALGFKKIKAPKAAWEPLLNFYNKYKDQAITEKWYRGGTIVNSWDAPSKMVSFENPNYEGGWQVKEKIWEGVRPIIEEWIGGYELKPTSLYGIRLYTDGSVLASHVDRLPLVSSCIINVDQDVDEPWLLEVYDHAGNAYNVSMEPGDLVLYESSTVLHGRPFPMKGRFYANIFVHFEPLVHAEMNAEDKLIQEGLATGEEPMGVKRRHGGTRTLRTNPRKLTADEESAIALRLAAARGSIEGLHDLLERKPHLLNAVDENNWSALHEAIRGGKTETVKYLVGRGADVRAKVKSGGAALWLARDAVPAGHEIITYLQSVKAPE